MGAEVAVTAGVAAASAYVSLSQSGLFVEGDRKKWSKCSNESAERGERSVSTSQWKKIGVQVSQRKRAGCFGWRLRRRIIKRRSVWWKLEER